MFKAAAVWVRMSAPRPALPPRVRSLANDIPRQCVYPGLHMYNARQPAEQRRTQTAITPHIHIIQTYILATALIPSRHVISDSFSFSISFLAACRPFPTAVP